MYNKKALKVDLGKFVKPNPYKQDIITDPAGQWKYPGVPTRIPSGQITMQGVPYPVMAYPNMGQPVMMQPGQEYNFPGADYVDEYPQMKKGGYMPSLPNKKTSKAYSRSLTATNKLFAQSPLTKKSKSRKNKIFDPSSAYYQDGGAFEDDIDKRRQLLRDWTYGADIGMLQEQDGGPYFEGYNEDSPWLGENYKDIGVSVGAGRFNVSAGNYFPKSVFEPASNFNPYVNLGVDLNKNRNLSFEYTPGYAGVTFTKSFQDGGEPDYIEMELTPEEIEEYRKGGYVVEDISVPTLTKAEYGMPMGTGMSQNYMGRKKTLYQAGGLISEKQYALGGAASPTDLNPATMKKYKEALKTQENSVKAGYNKAQDRWYPHVSPEGGNKTIGYGHKLTDAENNKFIKGISSGEVDQMLQSDILKHQAIAENIIDNKYGKGAFDRLPQASQMLFVDYAYNGVLGKFPTFTDAVVKKNKDLMLKEYERGSKAGKLVNRNNWTRSVIEDNYQEGGYIELELTPEEIQNYIAQGYSIDELD